MDPLSSVLLKLAKDCLRWGLVYGMLIHDVDSFVELFRVRGARDIHHLLSIGARIHDECKHVVCFHWALLELHFFFLNDNLFGGALCNFYCGLPRKYFLSILHLLKLKFNYFL